MRLIDAEELKRKLKIWCYNRTTTTPTFSFVTEEDIDECPTVNAISREVALEGIEELKKSPWATDKRGNGFEYLITEALDVVKDLCIKQAPPVTQKSETVTEFADCCRECGARYDKLLKQKFEWILVSERLPEDGTYLVTVERIDGKPRIDIRSFAKDLNKVDEFDFPKHKCGWYDYDGEYGYWEDTSVVAWMPLPEPYKVESEDNE